MFRGQTMSSVREIATAVMGGPAGVLGPLLAAVMVAGSGAAALAQPPAHLLKDIRTGNGAAVSEGPQELCRVGSTVFFRVHHTLTGRELWATDGTAAGTRLVKDIRVGNICSIPEHLVAFNGKCYFTADDSFNGNELWMSDGTTAGTVMVKDINPGAAGSMPLNLTVLSPSKLMFSAITAANGRELWVTDGTPAGTVMVKDINPGTGSGISDTKGRFCAVGSTLFFAANSGSTGLELWKSDGVAGGAGTALVKDINTAAGAGGMDTAVVDAQAGVNGLLVFNANDGASGEEPWVSNGTTAGTVTLKNIGAAAFNPSYPYSYKVVGTAPNQLLYFGAADGSNNYELWRTDGTTANTFVTKEVAPGTLASNPLCIDAIGNTLYFVATDDGANNYELYATQGTGATTVLVKDIVPGSAGSNPYPGIGLGTNLIFTATGVSAGNVELYISDGTAAGTTRLLDINPGVNPSSPGNYMLLGGKVLFTADNGVNGPELWSTDGTPGGTVLLKNTISEAAASSPAGFAALGDGRVLFAADDGAAGNELWITDANTAGGTTRLADIEPGATGSMPVSITPFGTPAFPSPLALVFAKIAGVQKAVVANANSAATVTLASTGTIAASPTAAVVNGRAYFPTSTGIWYTDGTAGGTGQALAAPGTGALTGAQSLVALGDRLVFFGGNADVGFEPFVLDAPAAPTVVGKYSVLKNIAGGPLASTTAGTNQAMAVQNGMAYFFGIDGLFTNLWRTDGTAAGTVAVKQVPVDFPATAPLVSTGTRLFFVAGNATTPSGSELWTSTGSVGSGQLVSDLNPGTASSNVANLTACDGSAYFTAFSVGLDRTDLYVCGDGVNITNLTGGLNGGLPRGALVSNVRCASRIVFFRLDDGVNGPELWRSNGTADGTFMVADLEPGALGSVPGGMTDTGGGSAARVAYAAETQDAGRELFVLGVCSTDFNRDGVKNPDDLGDYITGYFTEPPDPRSEYNNDTVINPDDLGDFITAYFGECE